MGGNRGGGAGIEGSGGRGDGDNINYLVKMITENKVFILFSFAKLSASDVCQIPFLTFISLGLAISLSLSVSVSVCVSPPSPAPPPPHMKRELCRYVSEESYYNN